MPRRRKTAMSARVTPPSGQYCGGLAVHPLVIPAATRASTQGKKGFVLGTSTNVEGGPDEPTLKVAVHVRSTLITTDVPHPASRNPLKVEPEPGTGVKPTVELGAKP